VLASELAHQGTLSDGGETNETTAQNVSVHDIDESCSFKLNLHTGDTSTSNIETG